MTIVISDHEELLDEAIAEYFVAADRGNPLSPETLVDRYPTIRDQLLAFFQAEGVLVEKLNFFRSSSHHNHSIPYRADGKTTDQHEERTSTNHRNPNVPGFDLMKVLGKGGMGVVYQARQIRANRLVALKMILGHRDDDTLTRERFRIEAQAIAEIDHPNIVKVFEVGEHDEKPYFAMEFCSSGSLQNKLNGNLLAPRDAAQIVAKLSDGIAVAHAKRIIHRDLKPANVLIGNDEEPKITDFGLAKRLDDDAAQTNTNAIMGTPTYMAPEQAFGLGKHASPAMDVYSLGVILYECLTGVVPFRGATVAETLDQVRKQEPVAVRVLQPRAPRDLETIALKCLQKEPSKRYGSARELADDLNRWLDGKPILARPVGIIERAGKWTRRNPVLAGLFLTMFLGILGTSWFAGQSWRNSVQSAFNESVATQNAATAAFNANEANKQTALAKQTLTKSLESMRQTLVQLTSDGLENTPGTREVRASLAKKLADGVEELVAIWPEDDAIHNLAATVWRVNGLAAIGMKSEQEAADLFRRGEKHIRKRLEHNPDHLPAKIELGKLLFHIGTRLDRTGKIQEAAKAIHEAGNIQSAICREVNPKDQPELAAESYHDYALTCSTAGTILGRTVSQDQEAMKVYKLATLHLHRALEITPPDGRFDIQVNVLLVHVKMALHHRGHHRYDEAIRELNVAEQTINQIPPESRQHESYLMRAASVYQVKSVALLESGRQNESSIALDEALLLRERLVQLNPQVPGYRMELATSHSVKAHLFFKEGNRPKTIEYMTRAVTESSQAVRILNDVKSHHEALWEFVSQLVNLHRKEKQWKEAMDVLANYALLIPGDLDKQYLAGREYAVTAQVLQKLLEKDKATQDLCDTAAKESVKWLIAVCKVSETHRAHVKKEVPLFALQSAPNAKALFQFVDFVLPESSSLPAK